MIIGGVGGAVALGGIITLIALFAGGGCGPSALPFAAGNLPSETRFVMRWDLTTGVADLHHMRASDVPDEGLWTDAAEKLCGGKDLFSELMSVPSVWGRKYAARALAHDNSLHQKAIECGKEMAGSIGARGGVYWITFMDDDERREVEVLSSGEDELPATVKYFKESSDPSNVVQTRCLVPWTEDDDDDCDDDARAAGKLDKTAAWAKGKLDNIKRFGSAYSPDGENSSTDLDRLDSMANDLAGYERGLAGVADGFHTRVTTGMDPGVSMYGEDETKELEELVKDKGKAWGYGRNGKGGVGDMKIVIVAKSESSAKDIKSKFKDYISKLKEKIDDDKTAEDDIREKEKDRDRNEREIDYKLAKRAMARRAIKKSKIESDGDRVIFTAEEVPKEKEQRHLDKYLDWRAKHAEAAAAIVQSIMDGEDPKKKDLDTLGGEDFVDLVAAYQAVKDGKWPFKPEKWSREKTFYVPGNGEYETESLDGKTLGIYTYPIGKTMLRKEFKKIAKKKNWSCSEMSTSNVYSCTKGGVEVRVIVGGKDGSGSLLLVRH